MATSGSKDFELDVADYIEEAFERCGLEVRTGYDLKTAKRSLNLMLADWSNRGLNQWTIKQRSLTLTANDGEYDLSSDVIDVLSVVVRVSGTDYSLLRLSRDDYITIPTKRHILYTMMRLLVWTMRIYSQIQWICLLGFIRVLPQG